jgi:hypothetical protein
MRQIVLFLLKLNFCFQFWKLTKYRAVTHLRATIYLLAGILPALLIIMILRMKYYSFEL